MQRAARTLVAVLALAIATPAHAGMCDDECVLHEIKNLEARAKSKTAAGDRTFGIFIEDDLDEIRAGKPKLVARMTAACGTILGVVPDDNDCIDILANLRVAQVNGHDVVAALGRRKNTVTDRRTIEALAAVQAPAAAAIAMARWSELAPQMEKQAKNADAMNDWAVWRNNAARAMAQGDADTRAFLARQVATPKLDRGVKRACTAAIAAIDKRLGKRADVP